MLFLVIFYLLCLSNCTGKKQIDSLNETEDRMEDAQVTEIEQMNSHQDELENQDLVPQESNCRKRNAWWIGTWGIDVLATQTHVVQSLSDEKEKIALQSLIEIMSKDFVVNIENKTTLDYQALGLKLNHIPYLPDRDDPKFKIIAKDRQGHEFQIFCLTNGNVWWKHANSDGLFIKQIQNSNSKSKNQKD
jgi:hypothetical protein